MSKRSANSSNANWGYEVFKSVADTNPDFLKSYFTIN